MSDPLTTFASMTARMESGAIMIDGALLKQIYTMLRMPAKAATTEVGYRLVDQEELNSLATQLSQPELAEILEEDGERLVGGLAVRRLVALVTAAAPYHVNAVHFDGSSYLAIGSLGATNSSQYGFSLWLRFSGGTTGFNLTWGHDTLGTNRPAAAFSQVNPGEFYIIFEVGANKFEVHSNLVLTPNVWHHVMGAFDTNMLPASRQAKIYVDGVQGQILSVNTGAAFSSVYNLKDMRFGADQYGDKQIADFAEVVIAPGQNWLTSGDITPAFRNLFRDPSTGKPANLATYISTIGQPSVFFSGNAATFPINKGWGGGFAVIGGGLTNASTSPSD